MAEIRSGPHLVCNGGGDMDITRRDFIKGLTALAGAIVASQFDRQLETLARVLSGPGEWVLTFDEAGFERLVCKGIEISGYIPCERGGASIECTFSFEPTELWTLATLTGPDGSAWTSPDGENWTCGDRRMRL